AKIGGVEGGSEIDPEGIVHRSCEYGDPLIEVIGAGVKHRAVVDGARTRVSRNREERRTIGIGELPFLAASHHASGVRLTEVQTGIVEVPNLGRYDQHSSVGIEGAVVPNPCQGRVHARQLVLRVESKLESDVRQSVPIVVDLDFVEYVGIEGEPGG